MSAADLEVVVDNRRTADRVDLSGGLSGEVYVAQTVLITQISRTGMQLESTFPLPLGALHDFRLTLESQSVIVKGRVAHARISEVDRDTLTYLSGIEFIEMSPAVEAAISRYVDSLQGA